MYNVSVSKFCSVYLRCRQTWPSRGPPCSPRGWGRGQRGRGWGRGWRPPVCARPSGGCRDQWHYITLSSPEVIIAHRILTRSQSSFEGGKLYYDPWPLTWRWRGCSQPPCPRSLSARRGCQGTPARSQCPRAWCRRLAAWFCPLRLELICISSSSNLLSWVPGLRLS